MSATSEATPRQLAVVERFARTAVLVVGDVMLDTYTSSPASDLPGGAANVARNAAALGSHCTILGVVGDDDAGSTLTRLLAAGGVSTRLETDHSRPTTRKMRFTDDSGRELMRVDRESNAVLYPDLAERLRRHVESLVADHDVLICSDYSKGMFDKSFLEHCIRLGRNARIPVVVAPRPKRDDYLAAARGASLFVVNAAEARFLVGDGGGDDEANARRLNESVEAPVVVTLGPGGMIACDGDCVVAFPARASAVVCPIGAGDTVAAWLAAGLAAGSSLIDAAEIANRAAGIVVAKPRTATVTTDELRRAL